MANEDIANLVRGGGEFLTTFGTGMMADAASRRGQPVLAESIQQAGQDATSLLRTRWFRRQSEVFNQRVGQPMVQNLQQAFSEYQKRTTPVRIPAGQDEKGNINYKEGLASYDPKTGQVVDVTPLDSPAAQRILQEANSQLTNTFHTSILSYLDEASKYGNNPFIAKGAENMMNVVTQWADKVSGGFRESMETQTAAIQNQRAQFAGESDRARAEAIRGSQGGVVGYQRGLLESEAEKRAAGIAATRAGTQKDLAMAEYYKSGGGRGEKTQYLPSKSPIERYFTLLDTKLRIGLDQEQERLYGAGYKDASEVEQLAINRIITRAVQTDTPQWTYREIQEKMYNSDDPNIRKYSAITIAEPYIEAAENAIRSGEKERATNLIGAARQMYRYHPDINRLESELAKELSPKELDTHYSTMLKAPTREKEALEKIIKDEQKELERMKRKITSPALASGPKVSNYQEIREQEAVIRLHKERLKEVEKRIDDLETQQSKRKVRSRALLAEQKAGLGLSE